MEGLIRSPRPVARANGHTKCGTYLLASSIAAALPAERRVTVRRGWAGETSGLFEHPDALLTLTPLRKLLVSTLQYDPSKLAHFPLRGWSGLALLRMVNDPSKLARHLSRDGG